MFEKEVEKLIGYATKLNNFFYFFYQFLPLFEKKMKKRLKIKPKLTTSIFYISNPNIFDLTLATM